LERRRIWHVTEGIGEVIVVPGLHDQRGSIDPDLTVLQACLRDLPQILQLRRIGSVEAALSVHSLKPGVLILLRVLPLGEVLCDPFRAALIVSATQPASDAHAYA